MRYKCPNCRKPTHTRGATCSSCLGEAHRVIHPPAPEAAITEPPVYESKVPVAPGRDAEGRNANGGLKYSSHKVRPSLFPVLCYWAIVQVLTFGAVKYTKDGVDGSDNWKKNSPTDYLDAVKRHITEWEMGRSVDPESGFHPLAHAACSLIFLLWFELTRDHGKK